MFVEEKTQGEVTEAPAKTMKLSEAIRIGCPMVREDRIFSGCALGAAYIAKTGRSLAGDYATLSCGGAYLEDGRWIAPGTVAVADLFEVPRRIADDVSQMHFNGKMTREQCADWLESQGY